MSKLLPLYDFTCQIDLQLSPGFVTFQLYELRVIEPCLPCLLINKRTRVIFDFLALKIIMKKNEVKDMSVVCKIKSTTYTYPCFNLAHYNEVLFIENHQNLC
jgi:hypothetical protein